MMCKKILAMVLSFALALSVGFPSNATVSGNDAVTAVEEQEPVVEEVYAEEEPTLYLAGTSLEEATEIELDTDYYGKFNDFRDETHWYKFELNASGRLQIDATIMDTSVRYYIYDSEEKELVDDYGTSIANEKCIISRSLDLTKGTYYFVLDKSYSTADYNLKLSFTGAEESFVESGNGTNNDFNSANTIKFGTVYKGQIARNDSADFYEVALSSSGCLQIDMNAIIEEIDCAIYDSEGTNIWSKRYSWDDNTKKISINQPRSLTKGTYYFVVSMWGGRTGNYDLKLSFEGVKESFVETGNGTNNDVTTANTIKVNTTYYGQLAVNDSVDFYKLVMSSADEITIDAVTMLDNITYIFYDSKGNVVWSSSPVVNEITQENTVSKNLNLAKGTYYFVVKVNRYLGGYSFKINQHIHKYKQKVTKATTTKNGKLVHKCSCGDVLSSRTIYYPKKIQLSLAAGYVYNGKVKKPTVKVKGSDGKVIKSSNYTVTYPKGCKNVGTYKVKVTFKGNYKGTATASFTIIPKKTSIASLKATSKGFTVKLKKQTTQTTGYQIQYSTKSSFKNAVTKTIKKNTTVTQKITKLKANKKYYVRVRTYKTVSGKKYYSDWSATKSVKTKK